jgi:thymidylate synthase
MRVVQVRNVSEAWGRLEETLRGAQQEQSRAGPVLVATCPVTTVYERPTERVLFCPQRDANPFFHLMEALWMLAGRQDAGFLNRYIRDFGPRFAETDGTVHGAYGHRWRHALGLDQLDEVVEKLSRNFQDRQAVIQMWDGARRHSPYAPFREMGSDDLTGDWRDRPCNTHVYLRVRWSGGVPVLDLTVLCRSNDAIWGAYGANAVHFSVLQEYLAARIAVGVGRMYQFSNNFHVYEGEWRRRRPSDEQSAAAQEVTLGCNPMFEAPQWIDMDLQRFMDWHENLWGGGADRNNTYHNIWFRNTGERVARSWFSRRAVGSLDAALSGARSIVCPAWRGACMDWLRRRGAE